MTFVGYSVTFFVSWWLILFMVLPFGIKSHSETDEKIEDGIEVGSPIKADIARKMLITTAIALGFISIVILVNYFDLISIK